MTELAKMLMLAKMSVLANSYKNGAARKFTKIALLAKLALLANLVSPSGHMRVYECAYAPAQVQKWRCSQMGKNGAARKIGDTRKSDLAPPHGGLPVRSPHAISTAAPSR